PTKRCSEMCCQGPASQEDRALPPPRTAPKDRSNIQVMELRACDKTSQRKTSVGLRLDQRWARTLVAKAKSSLPTARAEPLIAPAEEPPIMGKGLPWVWIRSISPMRFRTPA